MRWLGVLLLAVVANSYASIGTVDSHAGNGCEIHRDQDKHSGYKGSKIKSMDTYITTGCSSNLVFIDDTKVRITENSRLVIDDFVFDPNQSDAGRLAMRVSMGTVRYASGQVAKNNPQRVNIKTPTATIAVRGTDFTMTVDEVGRSLVVLVPSCRDGEKVKEYELEENTCRVGSIVVETAAGSVTLDRAFEGTYVASASVAPTPPTVINTVESKINNNLILVQPLEIQRAIREAQRSQRDRELEELEAEAQRQIAQRVQEEADEAARILKTAQNPDLGVCNATTHICVRWDNPIDDIKQRGRGVAYRILDNEHYAEIKTQGYSGNTRITVTHNDSMATETIGDGSPGGNIVTIRQSTGASRR
jgi:hypothetical protein